MGSADFFMRHRALPWPVPSIRLRIWLVTVVLGAITLQIPGLRAQTTSTTEGIVADQQGLPVAGAEIHVLNSGMGIDRSAKSESDGTYRVLGLPAGTYTVTVFKTGFVPTTVRNLEVTVNQTVTLNLSLKLGGQTEKVEVSGVAPLLESTTSSSGTTILPQQIEQMPINGRNYLDLLQLVPGVAINRQQDPSLDSATPILGERGGNAIFLIDGMPNRDEVNGGAAAQFNQDSILEFQVLTGSYKAEFGHGSGGVINVVSKSGTNDWHGGLSFFHRNYKLDSSDSSKVLDGEVPFLLRWDPSAQFGGPLLRDKIFFFGSAERILESRQLNFQFLPTTPPILVQLEAPFNLHTKIYDTRARGKLDEQLGRHRLSQQFNLTNTHVTDYLPLLAAINLPSTRNNFDTRRLMLGFNDTSTLGDQARPYLLNVFVQYRGEPAVTRPAHPEAGTASTLDNLFSGLSTGQLFGDQGQVQFGPGHTNLLIDQKYVSIGANLAKQIRRHDVKFGWDFQRTHVDGIEANNLFNQLFATIDDLGTFGPVSSGVYFLNAQGGLAASDNTIRLRNNYNGTFLQDDWRVVKNVTLNLGLRWDYDNEFPNKTNFSPRLGFAWSITPKTVVRASWGLFYDHFRLGLARDIPGFGGANLVTQTFLSFPRLFYGDPSTIAPLFALLTGKVPCASSDMTDAQIAASGATCMYGGTPVATPFYGIDHLNSVVAPGHAPIPANAVVNINNVQSLTGFTPQQFADAASSAVGLPAGSFIYDPFGDLSIGASAFPTSGIPISVAPGFKTPYTNSLHVGVQREIRSDLVIEVDYYHKNIDHILGVRDTNLAFEARAPGHTGETVPAGSPLVFGYGPWLHGTYDALTFGFRKRMNKRFTLDANYTWTHEIDNALNSSFISDLQTSFGAGFTDINGPTDSFVGMTTLVTDSATGQTNANGPFLASNGNPVPKAGIFYNGPDLDKGPSDLALNHTFLMHGLVQLPWKFDFSSIFRAQSGFHYSASFPGNVVSPDVDGDNLFNGVDFYSRCGDKPWSGGCRNNFVAPSFVNLDLRIAKRFDFGDRVKLHAYLEFFNMFNRDNPAAVNGLPPVPGSTSGAPNFAQVLQVLPGREGQVGIRLEF
jgi:Carboxypeptidase regulatory-like domain/TonB dependent receptor/TonB-dependent Receptor Plug Domain